MALKNDDAGGSDSEQEDSADEGENSRIAKAPVASQKQPTGRVVGVIKRNWRAYVCHIDRTSLASASATSLAQQTVFATPVSRLLPRIRLRTRQAPQLLGQKILVSIDRWDAASKYPEGHFVRALGTVESKEAETESLLLEFDVPYRPFGKAILDCLPPEGDSWVVPPKDPSRPEWRDREDLRQLLVCSIDPPSASSFRLSLQTLKKSVSQIARTSTTRSMRGHCLTVTSRPVFVRVLAPMCECALKSPVADIADVSHFVLPDNPMDSEAAARGTTVYLVDKRIDMLPSLLGTNLCSLRPHVERLAFSVIWVPPLLPYRFHALMVGRRNST